MSGRSRAGTVSNPSLRIDTTAINAGLSVGDSQLEAPASNDVPSLRTPRSRGRARALSQAVLPSFLSPGTPVDREKSPASPSRLRSPVLLQQPDRALRESRKLLDHILRELESRSLPPSVYEPFRNTDTTRNEKGLVAVVDSVRNAVNFKATKSKEGMHTRTASFYDDGSDDEEQFDDSFNTDETFDLMLQFREVLIIMQSQGWKIFAGERHEGRFEPEIESSGKLSSPFRMRRGSFQNNGRRSRSSSPNKTSDRPSELLHRCISILSSIVCEDCRFQISTPRLFRPPNALQLITLEVAQLLAHANHLRTDLLYELAMIMLTAFATFRKGMHTRLLQFYEDNIFRGLIEGFSVSDNALLRILGRSDGTDDTFDLGSGPGVEIQVEPADDTEVLPYQSENMGWIPWSSVTAEPTESTVASHAPHQSLNKYYATAIVAPLLTTILDNVDLSTIDIPKIHRVSRLLNLIIDRKPDACLDVLETIAYHPGVARKSAISLLSTFWPREIGHLVIANPPIIFSYVDIVHRSGIYQTSKLKQKHAHQFVPWSFGQYSSGNFSGSLSAPSCSGCNSELHGFGLICPFCVCAVHLDCYDPSEGSNLSAYPIINESNKEKVAIHRYSYLLPHRLDLEPEYIEKHRHRFRLSNIFTMCLCYVCRFPLWGTVAQGYKCTTCHYFVHDYCLLNDSSDVPLCQSITLDSTYFTIDWGVFRSSFVEFYGKVLFREQELRTRTYEEISTISSSLWIQIQLLRHGLLSGTILVIQANPQKATTDGFGVDDFELQYFARLYDAYLESGRLSISAQLEDFLREGRRPVASHRILFDWQTLVFMTSTVKQPISTGRYDIASSLLTVRDSTGLSDPVPSSAYPLQTTTLAHIRDALGVEFNFRNDQAASLMLVHLHHLGFFSCPEFPSLPFKCREVASSRCSFSIPLGLDLSADVETLITAVEVCLADLDVSVNEVGFLLLVRKLWPNSMSSEYALERSLRAVVVWILTEDDNLEIILRAYVAQNRSGTAAEVDTPLWPRTANSRSAMTGKNESGTYIASRKALLAWYAHPWLTSTHEMDSVLYGALMHKLLTQLAEDAAGIGTKDDMEELGEEMKQAKLSVWADHVFRSLSRLLTASVIFSSIDGMLKSLLIAVNDLGLCSAPIASLARLVSRDLEGPSRLYTTTDGPNSSNVTADHIPFPSFDIWRVVADSASENLEGLRRSLNWLCLFACSGVDIPLTIFMQLSAFARDISAPLEDGIILAEAALRCATRKPLGKQGLQALLSEMHSRYMTTLLKYMQDKENISLVHRFLRQSLTTCLLLYGCDSSKLIELSLLHESEKIRGVGRQRTATISPEEDPISMDIDLVAALSEYITIGDEVVCRLIAQFLGCFVADADFLHSHEVDNIILKHSHFMTRSVWRFYDLQDPKFSSIRISLLLRLLVVDAQPLERLLEDEFSLSTPWENRLQAASRLFSMVMDINSPLFRVDGQQWKSSVIPIFYYCFACLWHDDREEIRLTTEAWSKTLQPSHMEAISSCWDEALVKSPMSERVRLVGFLLQLREHFVKWKVLSWDIITETLQDDDSIQRNGRDVVEPASSHLSMFGISMEKRTMSNFAEDPEVAILRSSLVTLSLRMIADGVPIDIFSFLRVKFHLLSMFGFSDVTLTPTPSGQSFQVQFGSLDEVSELALPCIGALVSVLDAHQYIDLPLSSMIVTEDRTLSRQLVGCIVIDATLSLVNQIPDLAKVPFFALKGLLQAITVIIHKYDLEAEPLRHLRELLRKAVKRTIDLLLEDVGIEIRQLALHVNRIFLNRWPTYAANILQFQVEVVAKLLPPFRVHEDDVLVSHATIFLEDTLTRYASSGLFYQLLKKEAEDDKFFGVIRLITKLPSSTTLDLRTVLLKDTLTQVLQHPNDSAQSVVLLNIKRFVHVVHYEGYTSDLMQFTGRCFSTITRNASELSAEGFDPNPLLLTAATLLQHNKANSRAFIGHTETLFRIALGRFDVGVESIRRLLQVTSAFSRRVASQSANDDDSARLINPFSTILDIVFDALRGRTRVTSSTLAAITDALLTVSTNTPSGLLYLTTDNLLRVAGDAFSYLQTAVFPEIYTSKDLTALLKAASLVLHATGYDDGFLTRQLKELRLDRSGRMAVTVRAWNMLTLSALQSPSAGPGSIIFRNLRDFSAPYNMSLRMHIASIGLPTDITAADINHAYVAIKLWLLLAQKSSNDVEETNDGLLIMHNGERQLNENEKAWLVWNELWPPFERFLSLCEAETTKKELTPVAVLIWSSIADVFLFLRQIRSVIAFESSSHIAMLTRIRALGLDDATARKFSRAVTSFSDPPPQIPFETLLNQATSDLLAAEKLLTLEMRREVGWNAVQVAKS